MTVEVEDVLGVVGLVRARSLFVNTRSRHVIDRTPTVAAVVVVGGVFVRMTTSRHRLVGALVLGRRRQRQEASMMIGIAGRMDTTQMIEGSFAGKRELLFVEIDGNLVLFYMLSVWI